MIEDAQRLQGYMDRLGGGVYGLLADLEAGAAVTVRWWELPNPVKDSMPRPMNIQEPWELGSDDTLKRAP